MITSSPGLSRRLYVVDDEDGLPRERHMHVGSCHESLCARRMQVSGVHGEPVVHSSLQVVETLHTICFQPRRRPLATILPTPHSNFIGRNTSGLTASVILPDFFEPPIIIHEDGTFQTCTASPDFRLN